MKMHMTFVAVCLLLALLVPGFESKGDTTDPPITTPTTSNTTTQAPNTTTQAPNTTTPTTPPATTEAPPPERPDNHLVLRKDEKTVCILQNLNATFDVTDIKTGKVTYYDMTSAVVLKDNSSCGDLAKNESAYLTASWGEKDNISTLTQTFGIEKGYYYLETVELSLDGGKYNFSFDLPKGKLLQTSFKSSYKCDTNQTYEFTQNKTKGSDLTMSFSEVRFQAYDIEKNNFSKASSCPGDMPIPIPEVSWINNLTVYKDDNHTVACTMEIMNATFTVIRGSKEPFVFNMTNATVNRKDSQCGDKGKKPANVSASWGGNNTIIQVFAYKDDYYYLQRVILHLQYNDTRFSFDVNIDNLTDQAQVFYTPFKQSLLCKSKQTVKDPKHNLTMTFSDVRFQAYDIVNNTLSKEHTCAADNKMSSIVPIAVGAALAVLVIIVLIAYLIGRRNSSRAGYESV